MNKGRIFCVFTIVVLALFLFGCAKEEVKVLPAFDKDVAEEECAVLVIPKDSKVNRIDGEKPGWFKPWAPASKAATLSVPAGEHTIIFEYSHPLYGWAAKNLNVTLEMDAEKMYMLSVIFSEERERGVIYSAVNVAASFVRDSVLNYVPFFNLLPRANPEGVVYQIDEIDQDTFDQYLLDGETKLATNVRVLSIVFGFLWIILVSGILRSVFYLLFMGKFKNANVVVAAILSIGLLVAGILLINYNSGGALMLYLLATLLLSIGVSFWDIGSASNKRGIAALKGESIDSSGDASTDIDNILGELSARKFTNKYAKAIYHFSQAINASPYNADFISNRGSVYYQLQEWDKAIADFAKAAQLKPRNELYKRNLADAQAVAPNNSGLAKLNDKDYKGAIRDFNKAINFAPHNGIYLFNRGFTYYNLQDWDKAIADFNLAIVLAPGNAPFFNYRGLAYYNLQDLGKAIADFTEAVRLDPNNDTYKQNLEHTQTQPVKPKEVPPSVNAAAAPVSRPPAANPAANQRTAANAAANQRKPAARNTGKTAE